MCVCLCENVLKTISSILFLIFLLDFWITMTKHTVWVSKQNNHTLTHSLTPLFTLSLIYPYISILSCGDQSHFPSGFLCNNLMFHILFPHSSVIPLSLQMFTIWGMLLFSGLALRYCVCVSVCVRLCTHRKEAERERGRQGGRKRGRVLFCRQDYIVSPMSHFRHDFFYSLWLWLCGRTSERSTPKHPNNNKWSKFFR